MLAWPRLEIPRLDVHGPAVSVYDTEKRSLVTLRPDDAARMLRLWYHTVRLHSSRPCGHLRRLRSA